MTKNADSLGNRIKKIRQRFGLNQARFAEELLLGGPAAISKYEKNQRLPDIGTLAKISGMAKISLDELVFGCTPSKQQLEPEKGEGGQGLQKTEEIKDDENYVLIPQVSGEISAGGGLEPDNTIEMRIAFRKDWIQRKGKPESMSLIRVSGDSMEPTLLSGDMVLIDHNRNYLDHQGGIYAVSVNEHIMIKRIQITDYQTKIIKIISDNPHYEPIETTEEELKINGKVIWYGREIVR